MIWYFFTSRLLIAFSVRDLLIRILIDSFYNIL